MNLNEKIFWISDEEIIIEKLSWLDDSCSFMIIEDLKLI